MLNLIEGLIMNAQGPYFALQVWTGQTKSEMISNFFSTAYALFLRTKDKLRSGELAVSSNQWPVFLYAGYTYDPEDPWNSLLHSNLLVCMSLCCNLFYGSF